MILEMAVDFDPLNSVGHYTLGNVYAVLMQYNKSVESFDYALRLSDNLSWVKKRRAAVLVHTFIFEVSKLFILISVPPEIRKNPRKST